MQTWDGEKRVTAHATRDSAQALGLIGEVILCAGSIG